MAQFTAWEKEYKNPKVITNSNEPQVAFKDFVKWLRKKEGVDLSLLRVLDLGSGTGKNSIFLALRGADVSGIELSKKAVEIAHERAEKEGVKINFINGSFGDTFPFADDSFDLILDITSSNSLNEEEREMYRKECARVLKSGGHMFVRALCKDGDKNALNLLKLSPGKEHDTYFMKDIGLYERVFTREDIVNLYLSEFLILSLEKDINYTSLGGRSYKRNFWLAYLKKK